MIESIEEYLEDIFEFNIKVYPTTALDSNRYYIINDSEKLFFSFKYDFDDNLSYEQNLNAIRIEFEKHLLNIFKNLKYRA